MTYRFTVWCVRGETGEVLSRIEADGTPIWMIPKLYETEGPSSIRTGLRSILVFLDRDELLLRDLAEKTTLPGYPIRADLHWAAVTVSP